MKKHPTILLFSILLSVSIQTVGQSSTWIDSMELYSREVLMPPRKYAWTWQSAALLRTMIARYDQVSDKEKAVYLDYVKRSIDHVHLLVNGRNPNNVASGAGMAFLARVT